MGVIIPDFIWPHLFGKGGGGMISHEKNFFDLGSCLSTI